MISGSLRRWLALFLVPVHVAWAAEGEAALPPPPPPPPPMVPSLPYTPDPENPRLLELKSELYQARSSPSLGSGITLLALGGSFLFASLVMWGLGLGGYTPASATGTALPACGSTRAVFCVAGFAGTVAGLVLTPIGIVRLVRAITGRARIPALEAEIRQLGGHMTEE